VIWPEDITKSSYRLYWDKLRDALKCCRRALGIKPPIEHRRAQVRGAHIGSFAKGKFYYIARNRRAKWDGPITFCTTNKAFTRIGDECSEEETATKFEEVSIENRSQYTATLLAKPWTYTALAVSRTTSAWGWSGSGHQSREEAGSIAMQWCNGSASDCRVVGWVRDDACLALSSGENGNGGTSLGWVSRDTRAEARRVATEACRDADGTGCRIVNDSCD
jgi:hypothetical protein